MKPYEEKCAQLKIQIKKCLKLNIEVFGEECGGIMCQQLQTLYNKNCLDI